MEDPKPSETLGPQHPDAKTLQASGSSAFASSLVFQLQQNGKGINAGSNGVERGNAIEDVNTVAGIEENGSGVFEIENGQEGAMGIASNGRSVGLWGGSREEDVLEKTEREEEMKEEDVSGSNRVDSVRKFEVSGDHISLYVDFSEVSKGNTDEANASELMLSMEEPGEPGIIQEVEASDGQEYRFFVGDIVWVKTKNLSWWPGRVIDPLVAPEHVMKGVQGNCLLVSYFGNSHAAWCHPSQLRPFHLNFEQMSGQNKAKSFLCAVERAVYEFSRCVKLEMTCSCILKGNQLSADRSGVIPGVALPECKSSQLGEFSVSKFEPAAFLSQLKNLAAETSKPGMLEFTVVLSRLSAFYGFIGHSQLPLLEITGGEEPSGIRLDAREGEILQPNQNKDLTTISGGNGDTMPEDCSYIVSREGIVSGKLPPSSKKRKRKNDPEMRNGIGVEGLDHGILPSSSTTGGIVSTERHGDGESKIKYEKGFELRERKKSRYLSYPYVNWGNNNLPSEKEVDQSTESPPIVRSGAKRLQKKWSKKFISENDMSANPDLINASSADLHSELLSTAVNCLYPVESKNFGLTEWFFSKFRISVYHEESIYETYCNISQNEATAVDPGFSGSDPQNDKPTSPSTKSELKKGTKSSNSENKTPKRKKHAESEKSKMKSLSGLSDVNLTIFPTGILGKDLQVMAPSILDRQQTSAGMQAKQTANIPDLNGSGAIPISVGECPQVLSHLASEPKKRKRKRASSEHSMTMPLPTTGLLDVNGNNASFSSLMLSFQVAGPCSIKTVPYQNDNEGVSVGQHYSTGNSAAMAPDIFSLTTEGRPVRRKRKRRAKATPDLLNCMPDAGIPDLNGTATEPSAFGKDLQETNSLLATEKPEEKKRRRRRKKQTKLGIALSVNYDSGSTLLLTFAPGASLPSKEVLVAIFSKFGPLKESETLVLEDSGSAQVVFMRTADAGEAARSLEESNPFGAPLISHQLQIHPNLAPVKPSVPVPHSHVGEAPSLDYIKKNLEMMTSMLEKSGDNLSPEMRAKLEMEIKGLLNKVSLKPGSSSSQVEL